MTRERREHPEGAAGAESTPAGPAVAEQAVPERVDAGPVGAERRDVAGAGRDEEEATVPLPPIATSPSSGSPVPGPVPAEGAGPAPDPTPGPGESEPASGSTRADGVPRDAGPADAGSGGGPVGPDWRAWLAASLPGWRRPRGGVLAIAVLLALLGFSLVVQVKSVSTDSSLATTRQEDLVRILSDLEGQEERLRQEIAELDESRRQLASGAQGRQAALEEATRQADELGILAGALPARGPGLAVRFAAAGKPVRASTILDAVQELRGAGAEAMQISGAGGGAVRIVASTAFLDADGGLLAGGRRLTGPYVITVIGDPNTMRTALNIPGGVVASVRGDGGNVTIEERAVVDVSALAPPVDLRHARPVS